MTRKTPYNTGLAKVAVQCSADTFLVNQSLVLRINICDENRHLRQAPKRYAQCRQLLQILDRLPHKSVPSRVNTGQYSCIRQRLVSGI